MNDRRIRNLQRMAEIWTSRLSEAKSHLEDASTRRRKDSSRLRAIFRQCGLSLAHVKEEIEYRTGVLNPQRAEAFEQYSSALLAIRELHAQEVISSEQNEASVELTAKMEQAQQTADAALFQWCAA